MKVLRYFSNIQNDEYFANIKNYIETGQRHEYNTVESINCVLDRKPMMIDEKNTIKRKTIYLSKYRVFVMIFYLTVNSNEENTSIISLLKHSYYYNR